jgi:hypothetical protein
MSALFVGRGSPMNALKRNGYMSACVGSVSSFGKVFKQL